MTKHVEHQLDSQPLKDSVNVVPDGMFLNLESQENFAVPQANEPNLPRGSSGRSRKFHRGVSEFDKKKAYNHKAPYVVDISS